MLMPPQSATRGCVLSSRHWMLRLRPPDGVDELEERCERHAGMSGAAAMQTQLRHGTPTDEEAFKEVCQHGRCLSTPCCSPNAPNARRRASLGSACPPAVLLSCRAACAAYSRDGVRDGNVGEHALRGEGNSRKAKGELHRERRVDGCAKAVGRCSVCVLGERGGGVAAAGACGREGMCREGDWSRVWREWWMREKARSAPAGR